MPPGSLHIPVTEPGQAGEARRLTQAWALEAECGSEFAGRVALVATELAKNLALHTDRGGSLIVRRLREEGACAISVLSLDQGPGVDNFSRCLRDGYSTAGTSGIGLGGVQRMSRHLEVHSRRGLGTALYAEIHAHPPEPGEPSPEHRERHGAISVPLRGETLCGDGWARQEGPGWVRYLVADGLGHGPHAADAAEAARAVFHRSPGRALPDLLREMHEALRSTRGAAVAVAHLAWAQGRLEYAGVGNIAAQILTETKSTSLVSQNGTVGAAFPREVTVFTYALPPGSLCVFHSDGLKSQWSLERYSGLRGRHPELIAGVLYRDWARGNDDCTVLAVSFPA